MQQSAAVGYSPADAGPDQKVDVDLLQASVPIQQGAYKDAKQLLLPIQAERITTDQVYRLYSLRGAVHLAAGEYQEAVVDLRFAIRMTQNTLSAPAMFSGKPTFPCPTTPW